MRECRRALRVARTTPISRVSASRAGLRSAEEAPRREERRIVSVVFVDLVGFTSRSEQLDPEDVRAILTPYHGTVRDELESFGGVVEKFVGDAVMAVFGAPTAHGDDPERAVRAALAIREAVAALNAEQPELELRIRGAVNTGEAVVTLSARPALGEAMVAGDVVNTASRLQQHAPVGEIVVGEETYRATRSAIEYEPVEAVTAKGKSARSGLARGGGVVGCGRTRPVELAVRGTRPGGRSPRRDLGARRARTAPPPHHGARRSGRRQVAAHGRVHAAHRVPRRSRRPRPVPAVSRAQRVRRVRDAGQGARRYLRQRRRRGGDGEAAHPRGATRRQGGGRGRRRAHRDPARLRDEGDHTRSRQPLPVRPASSSKRERETRRRHSSSRTSTGPTPRSST